MGHEYPQSTFHGIDISPAFEKMELSKPKNCSFGIHNISKPFPFPENHFDFVHQRFVIAGIFENDWQEEVKNVMHVVKPGGYLELTEAVVPDIINCGPKLRLLSDASKYTLRFIKSIFIAYFCAAVHSERWMPGKRRSFFTRARNWASSTSRWSC